jgi:cyclase
MKRIRVIPALLIRDGGLVKSIRFKDFTYIGDPINAVKIFNDKEVDELMVLDISASSARTAPDMARIRELTSEVFMPLGYGGGITTLDQVKELIQSGVEKVVLNSSAYSDPDLVTAGASYVGSQSIVVSMDVKKNFWGKYKVFVLNGKKNTGFDPATYARRAEQAGAGEILLNAIDRDGTFEGFDTTLIELVSAAVSIPVVAMGGAASISDFTEAVQHGASAVAAGSMFVLQRPHRAVLISYPSQEDLAINFFSAVS